MTPADLRALLAEHYALSAAAVEPLAGGMNSATWSVTDGAGRWAAKLVTTRDAAGLRAGLHAAELLEAAGLPAGAALPTASGALSMSVADGELALLRWVEGRELEGDSAQEAALVGTTLGRAHTVLAGHRIPEAPTFDWVDPAAEHLGVERWVRPAVAGVLHEWADVRPAITTWGFLHGDPTPEAFLFDDTTGTCGVIDWAGGLHGPLLYDVASAAMYVGPELAPTLVSAYALSGAVAAEELDAGLPTLLRLRYAVQADYFARRLAEDDLTGIGDAAGNRKGLADARRLLGV